jgi:hypothetical protein
MLYYHILDKICVGGSKLLNFIRREPIFQIDKNTGTKTAIKKKKHFTHKIQNLNSITGLLPKKLKENYK